MNKLLTTLLFVCLSLTFLDAQSNSDFVTTWKTNIPGSPDTTTTILIPTFPGATYDYMVDWDNDGIFDEFGITGGTVHQYDIADADTVTIRIAGLFPRIYFNNLPYSKKEKLLSVDQWGTTSWTSMESAFRGCSNLTTLPAEAPDLSNVTDMSYLFYNCPKFNSDISNWDVSKVTNMKAMFVRATSFNQPIGNWNVSKATKMADMFTEATSFNQPIGNWDVGNVTDMNYMFYEATSFDQPIGNWDVGNVTEMEQLFYGATSFDQNLGSWNVSQVSIIFEMFEGVTLSTTNYDSLLLGWSTLDLQPNLNFSAGNSTYCLGAAARQSLIDNFNWTITDAGPSCITSVRPGQIAGPLRLAPNPTSDQIRIDLGGLPPMQYLYVFNQNGRRVRSINVENAPGLRVDMSQLPAGLYTICAFGKEGRVSARVVKQ